MFQCFILIGLSGVRWALLRNEVSAILLLIFFLSVTHTFLLEGLFLGFEVLSHKKKDLE
jgi:hypothetical protein